MTKLALTVKVCPCTVAMGVLSGTSAFSTRDGITWYVSTVVSKALSASRASLVTPNSISRAAKAALVGANTVNGPAPCNVPTSPAAATASTRMLKSGSADAVATMSLSAGSNTRSTRWTTPLLAWISVVVMLVTRLRPSVTFRPPAFSILKNPPDRGVIALPSGTSARTTVLPSTWYVSTAVSKGLLASRASLVTPNSVNSAAKAALVGAKTVSVPVLSAGARPAATTASTRMLSSGVFCATSTMLRCGSSSPPPQACKRVALAPSAVASKIVRRLNAVFMGRLLLMGQG